MSFDSGEYLIFLPLTVCAHWLCPRHLRWAVLLAASYLFYAWYDIRLSALILGVTAVSYAAAVGMEHASRRRGWLILTVAACLGVLGFFKYFNFLGRFTSALTGGVWKTWDIVLPVGISFYTFQAMSYVIDVYRGKLSPERHLGYYALYLSFFPQLVAGPIERAERLLPQLRARRELSLDDLRIGFQLLLNGFFRKLVIADLCAPFVQRAYSAACPTGFAVLVGTVLFALQIYCDFSGYSLIAAGSARLLGVRLMKNFDRPYLAVSLGDFWHRWHISLTNWLTDYVYIPLGGSRRGKVRQAAATMAVFTLSGLWHGANWTFLLWGVVHGTLLTVENLLKPREPRSAAGKWLGRTVTFILVCVSWIFFRADSVSTAVTMLAALVSPWRASAAISAMGITLVDVLTIGAAAAALPLVDRFSDGDSNGDFTWVWLLAAIAWAWLLRLEAGGGNTFIYFQF